MKKLIIALLTLMLTLSASMTAFATGTESTNNTDKLTEQGSFSSRDVHVTINPHQEIVYSVNVKWDSLEFTYDFGAWNPETHVYAGAWNKTEADINVTNHSNADIVVNAVFAENGESSYTDNEINVKADLTMGKFTLTSATNAYGKPGEADSTTITLRLEDKQPVITSTSKVLDKVKVVFQ